MKKYFILLSCTTLSIVSTFFFKSPQPPTDYSTASIDIAPAVLEETPSFLYVAKELDGYIAIYEPSNDLPYIVTDINVKSLPFEDQNSLKSGIHLDDTYTINHFIEDYSS